MNLLIVGGVAGGASAAARARRLSEEAHIVLFERGPDVSFANCGLPYYIGGEIAEREKLLVTTPERLRSRFNLDVRTQSSVEAIDRTKKTVRVRDLASGREYEEPYDKLILATGAGPPDRRLLPGRSTGLPRHSCFVAGRLQRVESRRLQDVFTASPGTSDEIEFERPEMTHSVTPPHQPEAAARPGATWPRWRFGLVSDSPARGIEFSRFIIDILTRKDIP